MPLPKPITGETAEKFIPRCMGDATMTKEFRDAKQRRAVCQSQWNDRNKKKSESQEKGGDLMQTLIEYTESEIGAVEREAGFLRGVCILAPTSVNKRTYTEAAMRQVADLVSSGVRVFENHPTKTEIRELRGDRDVTKLVGRTENGRFDDRQNKVFGDIKILPHKREMVLGIAETMPEIAGFSGRFGMDHGDIKKESNGWESIQAVRALGSVDIVSYPATTRTMYESAELEDGDTTKEEGGDQMDWSKATLEELKKERPDLLTELRAESDETERLKKLEDENKTLREEAEKFRTEKAAEERRESIVKLIKDSKLKRDEGSEQFDLLVGILDRMESEEERKKYIADLEKLESAGSGKPTGNGDGVNPYTGKSSSYREESTEEKTLKDVDTVLSEAIGR